MPRMITQWNAFHPHPAFNLIFTWDKMEQEHITSLNVCINHWYIYVWNFMCMKFHVYEILCVWDFNNMIIHLTEYLDELFKSVGFVTLSNELIDRKTVNVKEGVNVGRIFIQAKFRKPFSPWQVINHHNSTSFRIFCTVPDSNALNFFNLIGLK